MNTRISSPEVQEFKAMGILGRSIEILSWNLTAFSPIIFFSTIILIATAVSLDIGRELAGKEPHAATWAWMGCCILLQSVLEAALVYGAYQSMRGRPVTASECTQHGVRFALVAIGVSLAHTFLCLLGMIAFVVPGIIVSCGLFVAVPAAVLERDNALSRSWSLTKGYRGKIFGLSLLVAVPTIVASHFLTMTLGASGDYKAYSVLAACLEVANRVVIAVCSAVAYADLRAIKEGGGVDEIAAIFD